MLNITADTNTLVSATITKGNEFELLKSVKSGEIRLTLSPPILEEFKKVISRPKFGFSEEQIDDVFKRIVNISGIVLPETKVDVIKNDPPDNMVLECAYAAKADYIISGDKHLLNLKEYKNIKIITTSAFLNTMLKP